MSAPRSQIVIALLIVYLIWGSTYLAIRIAVETLPPFLMSGTRYILAGALMLAWESRRTGFQWPRASEWLTLTVAAIAMLIMGNGLVTWSEQWVPSNQAALIVAASALWIGWFGTFGPQGEALGLRSVLGLLVGLLGVGLLVGGGLQADMAPVRAYVALVIATLAWAAGSVFLRRRSLQCSAWTGGAVQMLIGGTLMTLLGVGLGEVERWQWEPRGLMAWGYLIVFGAFIGYGAYFWLVHNVRPALLATYAYVNPAVAVVLGALILDETLAPLQWLGTAIILLGVLGVTLDRRRA